MADVFFYEYNGPAPGTPTSKSSTEIRFKSADNAAADASDPLRIPGTNAEFYSKEKYLKLAIADLNGATISNIQLYTTAISAGKGIYMTAIVREDYAEPIGGDKVGQSTAAVGETKRSLFEYTPASPLVLHAGEIAVDGEIPEFLVLQMSIKANAEVGTLPSFQIAIRYDEE